MNERTAVAGGIGAAVLVGTAVAALAGAVRAFRDGYAAAGP